MNTTPPPQGNSCSKLPQVARGATIQLGLAKQWFGHRRGRRRRVLMQDDVVALFMYDRWANHKVLDACRKLTAEQYVAETAPGWSSVRSTVYHIALATEFNLRTLAGDPDDSIPAEADLATV